MPLTSIGYIGAQESFTLPTPAGVGGVLTTATVNDIDYNIHAFTSSGTFTVTSEGFFEILAAAGGGGGGMDNGGAGGAGELIYAPSYKLVPGDYSIVIGAGGAGAPTSAGSSTGDPASNGGDTSIVGEFTARGGGGGASGQGTVISRKGGQDGGCGGGGQGENFGVYFIYGGLGYGSKQDFSVSYTFSPAISHVLIVSASSAFDFEGDFTISIWVNQVNDNLPTPTSGSIFSTESGTTFYRLDYTANAQVGITSLRFFVSNDGVSQTVVQLPIGLSYQTWSHIAITRSGSVYRLYVSGKLVDEQTIENLPVLSGNGNLIIGGSWEGLLKDLHIISGEALYTSATYQVPRTAPTATENTVLLTLLDATPKDYSAYNHTVSENGSSIRSAITVENYGKDYGSPYSFPDEYITRGYAVESLSGGYITADDALSSLTSTSDLWTIETHIYPRLSTGNTFLFGLNSKSASANIILGGTDRLVVGATTTTFTTPLKIFGWQHYAMVFDGTNVSVYIDGVIQATGAPPSIPLASCFLVIGAEFDSGAVPGDYVYGNLKNIKVTPNQALYTDPYFIPPTVTDPVTITGDETLLIGTGPELVDYSFNNTSFTTYGNIKYSANTPLASTKKCRSFTSDYNSYYRLDNAITSLTSATDSWTFEMFIQSDIAWKDAPASEIYIIGLNSKAAGTNILLFNGARMVYYNGTSDVSIYYQQYLSKQWTHLVYSYDGVTLRVFFSGEKVLETAVPLNIPLADCVMGLCAEFDSANGGSAANYFYGKLRDVRITPGVCLYKNNFNSPNPIAADLPVHPQSSLLLFRNGHAEDATDNLTQVTAYNYGGTKTDTLVYSSIQWTPTVYKRYGHDGGRAGPAGDSGGGGGGGAGFPGQIAGADTGGLGGNGLYFDQFSNFGESGWFCGGGGGANSNSGSTASRAGGLGGGGNGGVTGQTGLANTGGGGGASRISIAGAAGGSGVVLIRYKTS